MSKRLYRRVQNTVLALALVFCQCSGGGRLRVQRNSAGRAITRVDFWRIGMSSSVAPDHWCGQHRCTMEHITRNKPGDAIDARSDGKRTAYRD